MNGTNKIKEEENKLSEKEKEIFMSILTDFVEIIDCKKNDDSTKKAKTDAWYRITVLFRKKTGKHRSVRYLRSKYGTVRGKIMVGCKNIEKSPSHGIPLFVGDYHRNELDSNDSATLKSYYPEPVTIKEENSLLVEMQPQVNMDEEDPLQLSMDETQVAIVENDPLQIKIGTEQVENDPLQLPMGPAQVENDPLQLPMEPAQVEKDPLQFPTEVSEVHPLDKSPLQPEDWLKINSLFCEKQESRYLKKYSRKVKSKTKDSFCQTVADKRNDVQKRMLEIEEARNEREKIMLKIEQARNEREKIMLQIEVERNERERKMFDIKKERNEQKTRILQLEARGLEDKKRIKELEKEKNEQEKLNLLLKAKQQNSKIWN